MVLGRKSEYSNQSKGAPVSIKLLSAGQNYQWTLPDGTVDLETPLTCMSFIVRVMKIFGKAPADG